SIRAGHLPWCEFIASLECYRRRPRGIASRGELLAFLERPDLPGVQLAQGLVQADARRGRQVDAPHLRCRHRNRHNRFGEALTQSEWQPARLATEKQTIVLAVFDFAVWTGGVGAETNDAQARQRLFEGVEVGMQANVDHVPVIASRPAQMAIVEPKTE